MNIISGQNVDLITPFPSTEVRRVFGWNHCYRTITENDDTPNNIEDFTAHMQQVLAVCPSWGIIDKNRLTNNSHEAPLVGIGLFEPQGIRGGFFHVATARKAFRTGLIDEAGEMVIRHLFETLPALLRLGAYMDEKNAPAKALCRRMGFKFEGICEDAFLQNGQPKGLACFGLTRRNWICRLETSTHNNLQGSLDKASQILSPELEAQEVLPLEDPNVQANMAGQ
jgi:RimJ/RimL family protein N-acetyltransferase